MKIFLIMVAGLGLCAPVPVQSQHSIAREWNEALLEAIRDDLARPTVHARNLFHSSALMYDIWALFDEKAVPYFLGRRHGSFDFPEIEIRIAEDSISARKEVLSHAMYRLLSYRFRRSPGQAASQKRFNELMAAHGYDFLYQGMDYQSGGWADLGNYLGQLVIDYGLTDGANESEDYESRFYEPVNPGLNPEEKGNESIVDPNRWQPLILEEFVGQSGIVQDVPSFVSPEWGKVIPFAMSASSAMRYERDGNAYYVYYDPGPPPYLGSSDEYNWGFAMVAAWSSHLDPSDSVKWDISPGAIGNVDQLPISLSEYHDFFNFSDGGDIGTGHSINPVTELPYEPQIVYRGDYTRVLAEFWADGPDSETPPGHWFTILNYVTDHPMTTRKWNGKGPTLSRLEWDVKSYFVLGGAMHDAAVAAWGAKGWYDYLRPISAIRYMADQGQNSDEDERRFSPHGIPLVEGNIEFVVSGDPLAEDGVGSSGSENIGKIKLRAWRGPDYVNEEKTNFAGVDWILAEDWWPYQRPDFVTPPFAGYVSGHSTFSRAAAVVLHQVTGDPFFPGGMGVFEVKKNDFLVFEEGPSQDFELQWATYYDASDQTSLSRIWGGIHPPADDIPGRLMGQKIGEDAFRYASDHINGSLVTGEVADGPLKLFSRIFPNPGTSSDLKIHLIRADLAYLTIHDLSGKEILKDLPLTRGVHEVRESIKLSRGSYIFRLFDGTSTDAHRVLIRD